jgi:multiple sugar transport system substrate-binding protein
VEGPVTTVDNSSGRGGVWRLLPYGIGFLGGVLILLLITSMQDVLHRRPALESGDLVILSGTDRSVGQQRQALVDRWNEKHPGNRARIVALPDSADLQHSAMISQAQQQRQQVDVYNLDVTWTAEFAAAGYIRELGDTDTGGFLPGPLTTCRFDGKLWALPFNTDAGLLYYRTDIFGQDGTGVLAQRPPSSQDMVTIADAAQRAHGPALKAGYVTQLKRYEGLSVNALEAIWAVGGEVVSDDGRVVLDPDKLRQALAPLAQGMVPAGSTPPSVLPASAQTDEEGSAQAFALGQVALMRNWPVWYGRLPQLSNGFDISSRFAVKPISHSVLGGQNLAIAAGTTRPVAAKALVEFLTSETSERTLFGAGGLPATRADVYRYKDVTTRQPYASALLTAVEQARPRPVTTHYPLFSDTFQDLVDRALHNNGQLPADAVRRMTDALNGRLPPPRS